MPDLDERRAVMKILEQSPRALSKDLIRPLPMQDHEDGGSGHLLSRSSVHADAREVQATKAAQQRERGKTLTRVDLFLVKTTVYIYFHILRM